jgi:zeaxanthin epoxidase
MRLVVLALALLVAAPVVQAFVSRTTTPLGLSVTPASRRFRSVIRMAADEDDDATTSAATALGLPARPGRSLKVAIAGGGVGGLTAALAMLQKGFDVTVYEKTAAFARFGGPIQFASNALSVLQEMDPTTFERVMAKFTFTGTRTCGIKDGLRADGSFRMTGDSLDYLWNKDAPADWFVKFPLKVRWLSWLLIAR